MITFDEWYAGEHGDSEGPWCREEMETAWQAGYDAATGHYATDPEASFK